MLAKIPVPDSDLVHPYIDPSRHVVHRLARKPSKSIMANFSDLDGERRLLSLSAG